MATAFIYALCEPGTRTVRYIGKTFGPPQKRLAQHLKESAKLDTHLGFWLRQVVSYGGIPDLFILRRVLGDSSEAEKRFIRLARGCQINLVNGTEGGEGGFPTSETRAKISASLRGEKNPMFGRRHSKETKEKMRAKGLLNPPSRAAIEASIVANKGVPKSPEHNAKNSAAQQRIWDARKEQAAITEWALAPYTLK